MKKRILIILGHPAHERKSFCEVLALAYQEAAQQAGNEVHFLNIAQLRFDPILHEGYQAKQLLEPDIASAQEKILWAELLVIIYPMWQFMIPALLKGFFERTLTQDFAYTLNTKNPLKNRLLKGKAVRLLQTMGMPSIIYRLLLMAHGAKALKRMLSFCGIHPINATYFGMIEGSDNRRKNYIKKAQMLGQAGI